MIILCPHCHTKFEVEAHDLKETGHNLRCSLCGHRWQRQTASESKEEQQPPKAAPIEKLLSVSSSSGAPELSPTLLANLEIKQPESRGKIIDMFKKIIALINGVAFLFLVIGALGYSFKSEIMRLVPESLPIYEFFNLVPEKPSRSLFIAVLTANERNENGHRWIDVSALIMNSSKKDTFDIPPVVINFIDSTGAVMEQKQSYQLEQKKIKPEEFVPFHFNAFELPEGAIDFRLGFEEVE